VLELNKNDCIPYVEDLNKQVNFVLECLISPYWTLRRFEKLHGKNRWFLKDLLVKHKNCPSNNGQINEGSKNIGKDKRGKGRVQEPSKKKGRGSNGGVGKRVISKRVHRMSRVRKTQHQKELLNTEFYNTLRELM
jgi:hypothetical protein